MHQISRDEDGININIDLMLFIAFANMVHDQMTYPYFSPVHRIILAFLLLHTFSITLFGQGQANNWVFGFGANITFNTFTNGYPTSLPNGQVNVQEGNATISDAQGNLLFYTEGIKVWDSTHTEMPNGNGLMGDPSSTQSAIIVPRPNHSEHYYIFTVDDYWGPNGLRYSKVDLALNGGLGDVDTTEKNIPLYTPTPEKIAAVGKADGSGYWVISHTAVGDTFLAYSVTSAGVNPVPVKSNTGIVLTGIGDEFLGYLKVSPEGKRLAAVHYTHSYYEVYDFNPQNGVVSNALQIPFTSHSANTTYGIEFSPNSERLYVSGWSNSALYQYDLTQGTSAAISASEQLIYTFNGGGGAMQIGPDDRIYCSRSNQPFLGVINNPNELGLACNYVDTAVALNFGTSSLGLPTFISSFFNLKITWEGKCFSDSIVFSTDTSGVDSLRWNFGDPNSGASNETTTLFPKHVFSDTGTFTVQLIGYRDTLTDTNYAEVTIYHYPSVDLVSDTALCDGDSLILDVSNDPVRYLWQDSTDSNAFVVRANGLYHVTLSNQCDTVSDSIRVIFDDSLTVDIGPDTLICDGQSFTFNSGLPDSLNLLWLSDSSTAPNLSLTNSDTVILLAQNGCGIFSDTAILNVKSIPFLDIPEDTTVCDGSSLLLTHPDSSDVEYFWSDSSSNAEFLVETSGVYSLAAQNECGFMVDSIEVLIVDPIALDLPSERTLCQGDSIQLNAYWNETSSYVWSDGTVGENITIKEHGLYSLTITDRGCEKQTSVDVIENPKGCNIRNCVIQAPNVFTPNQDGINDQLRLHRGEGSFSRYELNIFNRWGQLVFSSTNPLLGWDGTSNGELLTEGVYFYQLTYTYTDSFDENLDGTLNGMVTLLRE